MALPLIILTLAVISIIFIFIYLWDMTSTPEEFTINQFLFILALFFLALEEVIEYYIASQGAPPLTILYEILNVASGLCIVAGFIVHMWSDQSLADEEK